MNKKVLITILITIILLIFSIILYPIIKNNNYQKKLLNNIGTSESDKQEIKEITATEYISVEKPHIFYAGDPAREGAYIQALVRQEAGHNPDAEEKMVWIDSQTDDEIKRGIKIAKPFSAYTNLIKSAYERGIEDYAVGINFSRMFSLKYGRYANIYAGTTKYRPIAVGRVMTCVLGMVVQREREIENFKITPFYKLVSNVNGITAEWKAVETSKYHNSPLLYNENGFKDENDAIQFKNALPERIKIEKIERKTEKKYAPNLFNLAELQAECSKKFKISPNKTLEIAQKLYENKLTTYPRTDARVLSTAIAVEINKNLQGICNKYEKSECVAIAKEILSSGKYKTIKNTRYTDDSKIADHYAICPTGSGYGNYEQLSDIEKNVYELIVRRFLSIFLEPAEYDVIKLIENADNERFFAQTKVLSKPGYLKIAGIPKKENDIDITSFEKLMEGQLYDVVYEIKRGETTPPKRYTSGSMILAMENAGNLIEDEELRAQIKSSGIGTSATRSDTIEKLVRLEYISLNTKTQILTPACLGNIIYEIVDEITPELLNPKMTASWEKGLDGIVEGNVTAEQYRSKLKDYVIKEVNKMKAMTDNEKLITRISKYKNTNAFESVELNVVCPICKNKIKTTKFGCICTKFKKDASKEELEQKTACQFGISQIAGKTLNAKQIEQLLSSGETSEIKGFKSKAGKNFDAKLKFSIVTENNISKPKLEFVFAGPQESNINCPKCQKKLIKDKWNFSCDCGFKISHVIAKKDISDKNIEQLIEKGKTELIKGFKSKAGKSFKAYLVRDSEFKISFEFERENKE